MARTTTRSQRTDYPESQPSQSQRAPRGTQQQARRRGRVDEEEEEEEEEEEAGDDDEGQEGEIGGDDEEAVCISSFRTCIQRVQVHFLNVCSVGHAQTGPRARSFSDIQRAA
jgi:hypothetical protein